MHERTDAYIPYTHARRVAAEAPPGTRRGYTEFNIFNHVTPGRQFTPLHLARELLRLARHAWLVSREFL